MNNEYKADFTDIRGCCIRLHQHLDESSLKQSFVLKHHFGQIKTAFGKTAPLKESFLHDGTHTCYPCSLWLQPYFFLILKTSQSIMCNSVAITTISMRLEKKKRSFWKATVELVTVFSSTEACLPEPANLWRETLVRNKRILEGSLRKGDWD